MREILGFCIYPNHELLEHAAHNEHREVKQEEAIFTQTCSNTLTHHSWQFDHERQYMKFKMKTYLSTEPRPHYWAVPPSDHPVSDFPLCATNSLQEEKKKLRKYGFQTDSRWKNKTQHIAFLSSTQIKYWTQLDDGHSRWRIRLLV